MIKYIVYWVLSTTVSAPCPDSGPDEFGRTSTISCSAYHARIVKENKNREFFEREEAFEFYNKAKGQEEMTSWVIGPGSLIREVRIDSTITGIKIETESEYR